MPDDRECKRFIGERDALCNMSAGETVERLAGDGGGLAAMAAFAVAIVTFATFCFRSTVA